MKIELREEDGEVVQCDSCNCDAPTSGFDWRDLPNVERDRPLRMLCEFCCTTMASVHTREGPHLRDDYGGMRAEVWKAAACVFNMSQSALGVPSLKEELAAAYAELRKQRPAIKAVFDRDVWDRAMKEDET